MNQFGFTFLSVSQIFELAGHKTMKKKTWRTKNMGAREETERERERERELKIKIGGVARGDTCNAGVGPTSPI
jgi:hypothetical protein